MKNKILIEQNMQGAQKIFLITFILDRKKKVG